MNDQGESRRTIDGDELDDALEAGLHAAYGAAQPPLGNGWSVVESIHETLGVHPRVLLQDADDDCAPVVVPHSVAGAPGESLGRYQVFGEIARGGVGVVMKGRDRDLGRDVAIKMLRADHAQNATMVQRFIEEAQIAGQLQHPGVLPVFELGLSERRPYFTMKLVRGQTLSSLLEERPDLSLDRQRFLNVFEHVCQTMGYAHAKGVVHRDLKPSNIMVGAFGEVQVVDWGLAKVLPKEGSSVDRESALARSSQERTKIETVRTTHGSESIVGSVMGTPAYMSPEQARGEVDRLDERSDVFALGAILCEILTGKPPYVGERTAVLRAAAEGRLEDARGRLARCGADLELVQLAVECLAVEPDKRPRHAGAVSARLGAYFSSLEARARASEIAAAEAATKAKGERRARRLTLALATSVVFALLVVASGLFWVDRERRGRTSENTRLVDEALGATALLLGQAKAAPVGNRAEWDLVRAAAVQLHGLLAARDVDEETSRRAREFLAELRTSERDRRMIERIEEVVIVGATHEDRESWEWMYDAMLAAFADYGIDVLNHPREETAEQIRASGIAVQLTDGLDLWIATAFQLGTFNASRHSISDLLGYVELLYQADPDPFRTKLRKLIYTGQPDIAQLNVLRDSVRFEDLQPRTLSWLATAFAMAKDNQSAYDIFSRAVMTYPADFMLNFDFAYMLAPQKRWEEAIRYYVRCIAIRPHTGGVWRALGNALRETGDLRGSADALRESIRLQPDHSHTYVDLGLTLVRNGDLDGGMAAYREALRLKSDLALARCYLGLALREQGHFDEAVRELEQGHTLGSKDPSWRHPSAKWLRETKELLSGNGNP